MPNVKPRLPRINPTEIIADVSAYIDTFAMFSKRRPHKALMRGVRHAVQRPIWTEPCIRDGTIFGHVLIIPQPNAEALEYCDGWHDEFNASICRVDLALDFDARPGTSREQLIDFIENNLHMRYRRSTDNEIEIEGTRYAIRAADRKNRPSKNLCSYHDRIGKLDGECDKPHAEIRLMSSRAVKAAGVESPTDIITLNPRVLIAKSLIIADSAEYAQRAISKTISQHKPTPYIENVEQRAWAIWHLAGFNNLTRFKQFYPRQAERLTALNVLNVPDRLQWVRAGLIEQADSVEGELSCLSCSPEFTPKVCIRIQTQTRE